jgi:hypothetical protein
MGGGGGRGQCKRVQLGGGGAKQQVRSTTNDQTRPEQVSLASCRGLFPWPLSAERKRKGSRKEVKLRMLARMQTAGWWGRKGRKLAGVQRGGGGGGVMHPRYRQSRRYVALLQQAVRGVVVLVVLCCCAKVISAAAAAAFRFLRTRTTSMVCSSWLWRQQ